MKPTKETDDDERLRAEFEPHERATLREMMESFLRSRWLRKTAWNVVTYATAALILMGLFRDWISSLLATLRGGG